MKIYENLTHGIVVLVPTPRFLRELMSMPGFVLNNLFGTLETGLEWYKYIEYYSDELKVIVFVL